MKRLRICFDTSVIGGCLDEEFAEPSRALLEMVRRGQVTVLLSDLMAAEIRRAPESVVALFDSLPIESLEQVVETDESRWLAGRYVEAGVLGPGSSADARHVAIATLAHADMVVSWNFAHLVHFEKMRGFNAVNLREGYGPIEIHSPREVI